MVGGMELHFSGSEFSDFGCSFCGFQGVLLQIRTIVTEIITNLICWEFSPVMFWSIITEFIIGELFHPIVHCKILFMEFRSKHHRIGQRTVFSVVGPKFYEIDSLGMVSGHDPVKNSRKLCTENLFVW